MGQKFSNFFCNISVTFLVTFLYKQCKITSYNYLAKWDKICKPYKHTTDTFLRELSKFKEKKRQAFFDQIGL